MRRRPASTSVNMAAEVKAFDKLAIRKEALRAHLTMAVRMPVSFSKDDPLASSVRRRKSWHIVG